MTTIFPTRDSIADQYRAIFRWLRWSAAALAIGFGISAIVWPEYSKPLLIIPAILGGIGGMAIGWLFVPDFSDKAEREVRDAFWLRLIEKPESNVNQLDLFEQMVPDSGARRKVYKIITDKGEIRVLHVERFLELLVARTLDDAGRASDHAMAVAWQRCCEGIDPEHRPVLGKIFRETFKADVNGNIIRLLAKQGNQIIAELVPAAEPLNDEQHPFALRPIDPPPAKTRRKSGKSATG